MVVQMLKLRLAVPSQLILFLLPQPQRMCWRLWLLTLLVLLELV